MKKLSNLFEKYFPIAVKIGLFLFSASLIVMESYSQLTRTRLTTDFVSWALSGMAPVFKMGFPFVDYWGINPPGLLMMTTAWGIIAGPTLQSFHILFLILMSGIVFFVWKILSKTFPLLESAILFIFFNLIFFSRTVQSQFFPSEINGLFFTLLGLWLILRKKISNKNIFWASFCFILAGQMKEVFAFTGFAFFPHLLQAINQGKKQVGNFLKYVFLGIAASLLVIVAYLAVNQALAGYKTALDFKSDKFSLDDSARFENNLFKSIHFPKDRFIYPRYHMSAVLFFGFIASLVYLSLISKSSKNKSQIAKISFSLPKNSLKHAIIIFFWIGSIVGYALQGRYGNKYEITPLLPLILMLALSAKVMLKAILEFLGIKFLKKAFPVLMIIFLVAFIVPKKFFFDEYREDFKNHSFRNHIQRWFKLENEEELELETYIRNNTQESDCITAVYGWGVGSHYYYSKRKSCSKYFLVNILPTEKYDEYQQELIANPPRAIFYTHGGADLRVEQFESNAFNFSKVVESCYVPDKNFEKLYWSNLDPEGMTECLKLGIPAKEEDNDLK